MMRESHRKTCACFQPRFFPARTCGATVRHPARAGMGLTPVIFWFLLFAWSGLGAAFGPVILCFQTLSLIWRQ